MAAPLTSPTALIPLALCLILAPGEIFCRLGKRTAAPGKAETWFRNRAAWPRNRIDPSTVLQCRRKCQDLVAGERLHPHGEIFHMRPRANSPHHPHQAQLGRHFDHKTFLLKRLPHTCVSRLSVGLRFSHVVVQKILASQRDGVFRAIAGLGKRTCIPTNSPTPSSSWRFCSGFGDGSPRAFLRPVSVER